MGTPTHSERPGVDDGFAPSELTFLGFDAAGISFVLAPSDAEEICDLGRLSAIPMAPKHVEGILSWRGRPVPLVSIGAFAGVPARRTSAPAQRPERCVVATSEGMTIAIRCDDVHGIVRADGAPREISVSVPSGLVPHARQEIVVGKRLYLVFDLASFVGAARLRG